MDDKAIICCIGVSRVLIHIGSQCLHVPDNSPAVFMSLITNLFVVCGSSQGRSCLAICNVNASHQTNIQDSVAVLQFD